MLCPECMGPMVTRDGKTATCTLHGGEYRILFLRGQPMLPRPSIPPVVTTPAPVVSQPVASSAPVPGGQKLVEGQQAENPYRAPDGLLEKCVRHPQTTTQQHCAVCEAPICMVCAFPQSDGTQLCPDCVVQARQPMPVVSEVPEGVMCSRHPAVQAVVYCASCRQPTCATCDFALPGGVHVCPDCVTRTDQRLSSGRKTLLGWAYALAVWCTLGLILLFSGALADMANDPAGEEALGVVLWIFVFLPALIGTALSLAGFDRRLRNPPAMWVAMIWNLVIVAILVLLTVVGLLAQ